SVGTTNPLGQRRFALSTCDNCAPVSLVSCQSTVDPSGSVIVARSPNAPPESTTHRIDETRRSCLSITVEPASAAATFHILPRLSNEAAIYFFFLFRRNSRYLAVLIFGSPACGLPRFLRA